MPARIIDGKLAASDVRRRVREGVRALHVEHGIAPGLAVVRVGDDAASRVYVRTKTRRALEAGIRSFAYDLPADTPEAALLALLRELNERDDVHAILVQLPLPEHIDPGRIVSAIEPAKDVDGFHPENAGLLAAGRPAMIPCTPLAALRLIQTVRPALRGLESVVVGRSNIVGKPMAQLLLMHDCTVTIAHSATRKLVEVCRRADVLVVAAGKPGFLRAEAIKPGAIVIDVGINRVMRDRASRLAGDVDFETASTVAEAITPVPGGVGPMTVAVLLENTLRCAQRQLARRPQGVCETAPVAIGGNAWL